MDRELEINKLKQAVKEIKMILMQTSAELEILAEAVGAPRDELTKLGAKLLKEKYHNQG